MPKLKPSFCPAFEINTPCAPCPESPDDALHEACGVFGIWAPDADVARLTFFGLQALQHRGQDSAGISLHSILKVDSLSLTTARSPIRPICLKRWVVVKRRAARTELAPRALP